MKKNELRRGAPLPYTAPDAEIMSLRMEEGFLFDSFTGSGTGRKAADDLGDTDTDAGNAIWN